MVWDKECRQEYFRNYYAKNQQHLLAQGRESYKRNKLSIRQRMNEKERTKLGKLKRMYINMRRRSKDKNMPFSLLREEFVAFGLLNEHFNKLYDDNECVTVDRIDNTKFYTFDNIQFLSKRENTRKKYREDGLNNNHYCKKVSIEKNEEILNFNSIKECGIYLGVSQSGVSLAIKRKGKICGWKPSFANKEN